MVFELSGKDSLNHWYHGKLCNQKLGFVDPCTWLWDVIENERRTIVDLLLFYCINQSGARVTVTLINEGQQIPISFFSLFNFEKKFPCKISGWSTKMIASYQYFYQLSQSMFSFRISKCFSKYYSRTPIRSITLKMNNYGKGYFQLPCNFFLFYHLVKSIKDCI